MKPAEQATILAKAVFLSLADKDKQKDVNKFIAELQLLNQKEISLTVFGGAAKELVCPFMPQIVNKGNISEVKFIYHECVFITV